jgi:hypothetical protein
MWLWQVARFRDVKQNGACGELRTGQTTPAEIRAGCLTVFGVHRSSKWPSFRSGK